MILPFYSPWLAKELKSIDLSDLSQLKALQSKLSTVINSLRELLTEEYLNEHPTSMYAKAYTSLTRDEGLLNMRILEISPKETVVLTSEMFQNLLETGTVNIGGLDTSLGSLWSSPNSTWTFSPDSLTSIDNTSTVVSPYLDTSTTTSTTAITTHIANDT